ncbi:ClcB-like voltage-gated chloride channel protein [Bordetella sp. FB-8]|uniref:ClcB-like voltage-gated chloride channel protein n=1 Tax=Bordetella sp. FB-8 TaxID=1159870 RepID=UPI000524C76B|nr:ClcB-like voltage-gated chloride channel protein [Bordetella sp. FB-8]
MQRPSRSWRRPAAFYSGRRLVPDRLSVMLLAAAAVGVLGALATMVFRQGLEFMQVLLGRQPAHGMVSLAHSLPYWERLVLPVVGGAVAGLILQWARSKLPPQGAGDYMEAISLGRGLIGLRQTMARSLAAFFSITTGSSIGREGPMVQIAAMLASVCGRWLVWPPERLRLLVACGATAGLTAVYNAPIAGALFVSEIIYGSVSSAILVPLVVASVAANMVTRQLLHYDAVYHMPTFDFTSPWEVFTYLGLGVLAGLLAPWYLKMLNGSKRLFSRWIGPLWLRLAAGGLVVGVISVGWPQVWGNGYSVVNSLLHQPWAWQTVAVVLLMKLLATSASSGSGAVGGIFTPTLFMGAALGHLYGSTLHGILPQVSVSNYAAVGMGALLSAATHAPLMSILMIFEMTLSYQAMLPLMVACVMGYVVAEALGGKSMYAHSLAENRGTRRGTGR